MIPKRIIQTDKRPEASPMAKASAMNVKLLNPDFEYLFFDDSQVEEFVDSEWPQYKDVFDSFTVPIQKYDFFRYLVIYKLGGFYLDVDIILTSKLEGLLDKGCVFPFERLTWTDFLREKYGMDWEIGNYAFGASPGHPFLLAVIENCVKAQRNPNWAAEITKSLPALLRKDLYVIYTTGPGLVSRTLAEYMSGGRSIHVLFPKNVCDKKEWNLFGEYGVHLMQSSWRTGGGFRTKFVNFLSRRNETLALSRARTLGGFRKAGQEAEARPSLVPSNLLSDR